MSFEIKVESFEYWCLSTAIICYFVFIESSFEFVHFPELKVHLWIILFSKLAQCEIIW